MSTQRFKARIEQSGTRTFLAVPFDPNEVWSEKDRHYVNGSIGGHKIRGVLVSDGIYFFLPIGPSWRRERPLEAGAMVDVVLAPDGPQADALAPDIADALDAEPDAARFFQSIAPFYRKNFVRWIDSAKRPETRAARIAEAVTMLKAGKRRQ